MHSYIQNIFRAVVNNFPTSDAFISVQKTGKRISGCLIHFSCLIMKILIGYITLLSKKKLYIICIISISGIPPGALFPHPPGTNPNALSQRSIFSEHPATPGSGSITLPGSIDSKFNRHIHAAWNDQGLTETMHLHRCVH